MFALAGGLVIEAAVTYKPAKAGGIDKALLTLRNQPFGEFLLILAALGLIIFGIYGLCEARWRSICSRWTWCVTLRRRSRPARRAGRAR